MGIHGYRCRPEPRQTNGAKMVTSDNNLLLDDSPHTGAKHQLYRYYLDAWLPILIRGGMPRVRIVDGFAGPGRYSSGREGSPQVAIRAILENPQLHGNRRILLQFIEQNPERARHLEHELANLQTRPIFEFEVKPGDFASVWAAEMNGLEASRTRLEPTLLFLDGFGYSGLPLQLLARARGYPSCEVLINLLGTQSTTGPLMTQPSMVH